MEHDRSGLVEADLERVRRFIERAEWRFAASMPTIPHEYVLRREFGDDEEFDWMVTHIREAGQFGWWRRRRNRYLVIDGFWMWSMGAPIAETVLINRANDEATAPSWSHPGPKPAPEDMTAAERAVELEELLRQARNKLRRARRVAQLDELDVSEIDRLGKAVEQLRRDTEAGQLELGVPE